MLKTKHTKLESESKQQNLTFPCAELLVLNLYFMVDSQNNIMNDLELLSLLGEIDRILFTTECKNVILVRDINCDFSRPTQFVQSIPFFKELYSPLYSQYIQF